MEKKKKKAFKDWKPSEPLSCFIHQRADVLLICSNHKTLQSPVTKQEASGSPIQLTAAPTRDLSSERLAGSPAPSGLTQLNHATEGELGNPPWATQQETRSAAASSQLHHIYSHRHAASAGTETGFTLTAGRGSVHPAHVRSGSTSRSVCLCLQYFRSFLLVWTWTAWL